MKKQFKILICAVCALLCILGFAACGGGDSESGGVKNYVMEAEYIYLDGVMGAGISSEASGVNMIFGNGNDADKAKGWSNGYYVGFTYAAGLTLDFKFNSDAAGSATIILRLGSEIGNVTFGPDSLALKVNGAAVTYTNIYIPGSAMDSLSFTDKTVTTNASLIKGENTVSLVVQNNTLLGGAQTGGPMVDCIKIKTKALLTWTDKTDNPGRRGEI